MCHLVILCAFNCWSDVPSNAMLHWRIMVVMCGWAISDRWHLPEFYSISLCDPFPPCLGVGDLGREDCAMFWHFGMLLALPGKEKSSAICGEHVLDFSLDNYQGVLAGVGNCSSIRWCDMHVTKRRSVNGAEASCVQIDLSSTPLLQVVDFVWCTSKSLSRPSSGKAPPPPTHTHTHKQKKRLFYGGILPRIARGFL